MEASWSRTLGRMGHFMSLPLLLLLCRGGLLVYSTLPQTVGHRWDNDFQQSKGGGSMGRKSGSFFSPVLHLWLLKICFCWKQGVFSQQIIIYSHQPTRVKLQGRKAPFLWLSAQPWPYIQNLPGMKKPSANEIMFLWLNLPGPSSLQSQLRQSSFWVIPVSPWALEASGVGITPAVSSAAGSSLSSSETILHLPPYPNLQRNHRYLL